MFGATFHIGPIRSLPGRDGPAAPAAPCRCRVRLKNSGPLVSWRMCNSSAIFDMWNAFKRKPATPVRVASDDVISLHHFDDNPVLRNIVANFLLKFDDVLDPEKLRTALEKLLSREDGWRKLTARLRLNVRRPLNPQTAVHRSIPNKKPLDVFEKNRLAHSCFLPG